MRTFALAGWNLFLSATLGVAQSAQVPALHAVSLTRGNIISRSNIARSVGNTTFANYSAETTRIAAVRVQLRSFSKPIVPYEVQCFFTAKDTSRQRYIFDVVKTSSIEIFDEVDLFARDLFGGSSTLDRETTTDRFVRITPYSPPVIDTFTTTTISGTAIPGAKLEGWIVRIVRGGKIVRLDASLQELKTFAEKESAFLNRVAADFKP